MRNQKQIASIILKVNTSLKIGAIVVSDLYSVAVSKS